MSNYCTLLTKGEKEFVQYNILKRIFEDDTKTTPAKMMNISDVKTNILQWVVDHDGGMPGADLHWDIRKKQKLAGVPLSGRSL